MGRSYQRAGRAAAVAAGLLAAACGRPEAALPEPPVAPPDPAGIVASATYDAVGVLADGAWVVANETRNGHTRAVRLRRDAETPEPLALLPSTPVQSRALGPTAGGGRMVVATVRPETAAAAELRLVDAEGSVAAFVALDRDERIVALSDDGTRLWTAEPDAAGERLVERALPAGIRRSAPAIPRGFDVALVDGRGERVVLSRTVEPGRDEVVLFDRSTGAATLLLPADRDGAFAPLALDAGGARLLVAAREAESAPRLLEIELETGATRALPGPACEAAAARPLVGGGWLVRRRCEDGARIDVVGAAIELPGPPASGAVWRSLVPVAGGGWLGAAAPAGAPAALWWIAPSGDRVPLTWGLAPRLDPRSLPVPETTAVRVGDHRLLAERWPVVGRPSGALLLLHSPTAPFDPGAFASVPSALAARGVESVVVRLPSGANPSPELVDAIVAAWSTRAAEGRRAVVGGSGSAADAILARARRLAEPALVAVEPTPSPLVDPELAQTPLRASTTLLTRRDGDPAAFGVDGADPRLAVLRIALPVTPGEWPRELLGIPFAAAETP